MLSVFLDIVISIILPVSVTIVVKVLNLSNIIASTCISLIPTGILMYKYYSNKPSVYLKFLTKIKSRSNVKMNFKYYCNVNFKNETNYNILIERYLEKLKEECDAKIKYTRSGKLNCDSLIEVDSQIYNFNYNCESRELNFEISTKISFGLFIKEIRRATRPFDKITKQYKDIFFDNNIQSIEVKFLKIYDKTNISNPLFYKIYNDFDIIKTLLEYKTKNDTRVILNNSSIIFKGKNELYEFIEDVKKQM